MKLRWILITVLIIICSIGYAIFGMTSHPNSQIKARNLHLQQTNSIGQNRMINLEKRDNRLKILLPLYSYPNWYDRDKYLWKQVVTAAKKVTIVAIINPNNGPDRAPPNTDYQQGIKDLNRAGIKMVGYVPSNYANRNLQAVKTDIDLYVKYFHLDGIFIDEMSSDRGKIDYYQQLYRYIKERSPQYLVIANPGTIVDETYISQPVADLTVLFENNLQAWGNYRPPAYITKYSSQRFAGLIHTTPNRKLMKNILDRSIKDRFGYIYITNDSTNSTNQNPWDTLPEYWQAQVNYIHQLNDAGVGSRE
jgi:hypothetical protein